MPNSKIEKLSPDKLVAETRASIAYLNERLQTGSAVDPRNTSDRRAVTFAVVHQFDLPKNERWGGTEVLAKLWENNQMTKTPTLRFLGEHAHAVWREVLGKP